MSLSLVCGCLFGASADVVLAGLLQQVPADEAAFRLATRDLASAQAPVAVAVWQELRGEPALALAALAPLGANLDPFLLASKAYWSARIGQGQAARQILAALDARAVSGLDAVAALLASVCLQDAGAADALEQARRGLERAVPQPAYETWRSQLLRRRLTACAAQGDLARLGPELLALRDADRRRGQAAEAATAYAALIVRFPIGPVAATARLEAARFALAQGDAKALAAQLKGVGDDAPPALRAQALLIEGDAALLRGDGKAASAAYRLALEALARTDRSPAMAAGMAEAAADTPAHYLDHAGYPRWKSRREGALWIPACAPWIAGHLRYVCLGRLAVAAWLAGDRPGATQLANASFDYDPADRAQDYAPGSRVLAKALGRDHLLLESDETAAFAPRQRPAIALAAAAYLLYDWDACLDFLAIAERLGGGGGGGGLAVRATAYTRGRCHMMRRELPRALACFAAAAGSQHDEFWGKARMAEFAIVHQDDNDGPQRGDRILDEILAGLPAASGLAREALLARATLWTMRDPARSRRLYQDFSRRYPDFHPQTIAMLIAELPPERTTKP